MTNLKHGIFMSYVKKILYILLPDRSVVFVRSFIRFLILNVYNFKNGCYSTLIFTYGRIVLFFRN